MTLKVELLEAREVPLRHLVAMNPGPPPLHSEESCYLPMEAVSEFRDPDTSRLRSTQQLAAGYTYLADGDVAYAKVTPCFENGKGLVARGLPDGRAFATTEVTVLRPKRELDASYLAWVLQSDQFRAGAIAHMSGAGGLRRVPESYTAAFKIRQPALAVQRAIATYLDRETAQIDAFIAKNEELIHLLGERRAAVISEHLGGGRKAEPWGDNGAVAHVRLRHVLRRVEQGASPQAEAGLADGVGQVGVLKSGCANEGAFRPTEHKLLPSDYPVESAFLVKPGDLIVNRASGSVRLLGSAAIVSESPYTLMLSDKTFRLSPNGRISAEYLYWVLNSALYRSQVEATVSGADGLANNLPLSRLRGFFIPLPTRLAQARIVKDLERCTADIDAAARTARRAVELAKERRSALISAAVTGKIDVGEVA